MCIFEDCREVGKAGCFDSNHKCKHHPSHSYTAILQISSQTISIRINSPYMHLKPLTSISRVPAIARMSTSTTPKLNPRNFPRPPLCEHTPRHLQVVWNGTTIAETKEAFWVLETYHPPTYYLPPSSLKVTLSTTPRSSYCEWKGQATYYSVTNPADSTGTVRDRIWSYDSPTEGFKGIKGFFELLCGAVGLFC